MKLQLNHLQHLRAIRKKIKDNKKRNKQILKQSQEITPEELSHTDTYRERHNQDQNTYKKVDGSMHSQGTAYLGSNSKNGSQALLSQHLKNEKQDS